MSGTDGGSSDRVGSDSSDRIDDGCGADVDGGVLMVSVVLVTVINSGRQGSESIVDGGCSPGGYSKKW